MSDLASRSSGFNAESWLAWEVSQRCLLSFSCLDEMTNGTCVVTAGHYCVTMVKGLTTAVYETQIACEACKRPDFSILVTRRRWKTNISVSRFGSIATDA